MPSEPLWRVVLIGDDPLARSGLVFLCGSASLAVMAQGSTSEAAQLIAREPPDVVVWDLGESSRSLEKLRAVSAVPVIALIESAEDVAEVLGAGAKGVFFREVDAGQLAAAVPAIARRSVVMDEALAPHLGRTRQAPLSGEALTARETEVLQLLAEGLSNKEIGNRLHISEHTAKFHVNAILGKLGAASRTEAAIQAARLGLLIL